MSEPRIVFMGTGDIAIPSFACLLGKGMCALVTQPDKPVGRKQVLTAPKIKQLALQHGIPVMQPKSARDDQFLAELSDLNPEIIVVMAYGQILNQKLLDIPTVACINLHASLLPKYRGAACIQAAIDAGDSSTGITAMHVVKALDAGDIILKQEVVIGEKETGGELHDRLAEISPEVLLEALEMLKSGDAPRTAQDESQMSYISKLTRDDGQIDWTTSADQIERRIRAYAPWPGTSSIYTETSGRHKGRKKRLKIFPQTEVVKQSGKPGEVLSIDGELIVACGNDALLINELQADGGRRMTAGEFLLSSPLSVGQILG